MRTVSAFVPARWDPPCASPRQHKKTACGVGTPRTRSQRFHAKANTVAMSPRAAEEADRAAAPKPRPADSSDAGQSSR